MIRTVSYATVGLFMLGGALTGFVTGTIVAGRGKTAAAADDLALFLLAMIVSLLLGGICAAAAWTGLRELRSNDSENPKG
jgi:hypothetical protein